jgi:glycosyltransferase involved in cell wall biosynthesis
MSIVVNNYNYADFLPHAIDSALGQTAEDVEVIVVDDGSTDGSREVIASYGERIKGVLKENGGQASAFNAGFAASSGEIVCFLDADDALAPTAAGQAIAHLLPGRAKVHWPLLEIDEAGRLTGAVRPRKVLAEGDLRDEIVRDGPDSHLSAPTSGNAWSRDFLERALPLPAEDFRISADAILYELAAAFGPIARLDAPQGFYRLHSRNNYARLDFEMKLRHDRASYDRRCDVLAGFCRTLGVEVDPNDWKRRSWQHRFPVARRELAAVVPPGDSVILVDEQALGPEVAPDRRVIPFLEHNGEYWGRPADDDVAIRELERLRGEGAGYVAVAWPSFWWMDHYQGLADHLRSSARLVLDNERLVVFDLRS